METNKRGLEGTETILVVDDDTFMLSLAVSLLACYGYNVLIASTGEEVLHMLKTWPDLKIDLAVTDIVMPGMNGADLAQHLNEIRPTMPIIFMSAYSENPALRPVPFRNHIFLAKPFTSMTLAAKVREALDTPRSDAAVSSSG